MLRQLSSAATWRKRDYGGVQASERKTLRKLQSEIPPTHILESPTFLHNSARMTLDTRGVRAFCSSASAIGGGPFDGLREIQDFLKDCEPIC